MSAHSGLSQPQASKTMPTHPTARAGITDANPSVAEMEARVARFQRLVPTDDYVDAAIPGGKRRDGGIAAFDHQRLITTFLHHVLDQTALYGVVVGDQNGGNHGLLPALRLFVLNRGNLTEAH